MRLSDLLGTSVVTESGVRLGSIHEVRAEQGRSRLTVTGLVVGRMGLLERLGIKGLGRHEHLRRTDVIPWSDVVETRADRVVVRERRDS